MKKVWVVVIILVLLLAAGAYWVLSVPSVSAAILYVEEGMVEIDTGNGWQPGSDEMELDEGTKVRTGEGTASVILKEGEILHLEPHTEVLLSEIGDTTLKVKHLAGETWHKITRISGIAEYDVETPTTVATVRGTEFYVRSGEEDDLAVEEGEVETGFAVTPAKRLMIGAKRKVRMQQATDQMIEEEMGDDPRPAKFKAIYVSHLKHLREREINKNTALVAMAKKKSGMSDEQIHQYLEDMDRGSKDVDALYNKVPDFLKPKIERAYKMTKAIQQALQP